MSGMAEVLAAHHVSVGNQGGWYCSTFACGSFTHLHDATIHQAAALTAAGFGPVKEAGAVALEEAAAVIEARAQNLAGFWVGKEPTDLVKGSWWAMRHEARTIRHRAATIRSDVA